MKLQISQLKKMIELAEQLKCETVDTLCYQGCLEMELIVNNNNEVIVKYHDDQPELTTIVHTKTSKI